MRCRLKRTLQAIAICACLVLYINFFLFTKSSFSIDFTSGEFKRRSLDESPKEGIRKAVEKKSPVLVTQFNHLDNDSENITKLYEHKVNVYPSGEQYKDDRILSQLQFVPNSVLKAQAQGREVPLKKILLHGGLGNWAVKKGQTTFIQQQCKVPYCSLTDSRGNIEEADVVLFQGMPRSGLHKPAHQVWMLYLLESPYHTPGLSSYNGVFNWTATYRHDSTIVAPYEKFVPYNSSVLTLPLTKNYAEGKTKKVAWFVSNCGARNLRRKYAEELKKYIDVDIYGHCGTLKCPRHQSSKCFDMLNNDYKFYLSFENSNCRDYITEKFFVNGLKHDVIPIVMGAAPEDYYRASPPHSFIHVDEFESPKDLAEYLHKLDKDDTLYNEYFRWKGTGDIINTYFWCRVCALAHDVEERGPSWYDNVDKWWRGEDVCIGQNTWREKPRTKKLIGDLPKMIPTR